MPTILVRFYHWGKTLPFATYSFVGSINDLAKLLKEKGWLEDCADNWKKDSKKLSILIIPEMDLESEALN